MLIFVKFNLFIFQEVGQIDHGICMEKEISRMQIAVDFFFFLRCLLTYACKFLTSIVRYNFSYANCLFHYYSYAYYLHYSILLVLYVTK